jgi:hypothetical protein
LPLRPNSWIAQRANTFAVPHSNVYRADVYHDGYPAVIFENNNVRLVVSPCAGARAFVFEDKTSTQNVFTTIGGLRDAWSQTLAPSARDYIAKYTHPIATGTFNRCYSVRVPPHSRGKAVFSYSAPDAPPHGATFVKSIQIDDAGATFTVRIDARFPLSSTQRAQQLTSFALDASTRILRTSNGFGLYTPRMHRVALVAWTGRDVIASSLDRHDRDGLLTLTYASGAIRSTRYGLSPVNSLAAAQATLRAFANRR